MTETREGPEPMPECIFAYRFTGMRWEGKWTVGPYSQEQDYVRGDLHAALAAEAESLQADEWMESALRQTGRADRLAAERDALWERVAALDAMPHGEPITFTYTNWRGETAERTALPAFIFWGATDWHPEPQWLMRALDVEKGQPRDFALRDCVFRPAPATEEPRNG
jgi:hypothetical protein